MNKISIPDISNYELSDTLKDKIERSITHLPNKDRNNERKILTQFFKECEAQYGDATTEDFAEKMEFIGIKNTFDVDKAIWAFFDQYHVGKRKEPKIKN